MSKAFDLVDLNTFFIQILQEHVIQFCRGYNQPFNLSTRLFR